MPTFENGWICRKCWCANRETDDRCYRCHAVPERHVMPEPVTFSTPDGKPNEDRKKVSSLIGSAVPRPPEEAPEPVAAPAAPSMPAISLSERINGLIFWRWARTARSAITGTFARLLSFGRAVRDAPGAGARRVSGSVRGAKQEASSRARSAMSHRRVWLSAAWGISALSSALLFSAALHAPFAASLLVVLSVAVFSGLTAAITTTASERGALRMSRRAMDEHSEAQPAAHTFVPAPDHPAQPAEVFGSRPAR